MDENDDQGAQARSRSQSRRRRRQNQRQRQSLQQNQAQGQAQSGGANAQSQAMAPIQEQPENTMQPFEWIGPDSTSMDGPVTYARAMRGEIPMRPGNPEQRLKTAGGGKSLDDEEGLKLKLELNLDVEVELKAKIYGDLTIALLA